MPTTCKKCEKSIAAVCGDCRTQEVLFAANLVKATTLKKLGSCTPQEVESAIEFLRKEIKT